MQGKFIMNFIKKEKTKTIIVSALLILFGILFCLLPQKFVNAIETALSVFLIIYGLFLIISYCVQPLIYRNSTTIVEGIAIICIGVLLALIPSLFVLGIGIAILISGLKTFGYAFDVKEIGDKHWWVDLVSGAFVFALGITIVVLCNTKTATNILMIMLGLSLAVKVVINLILVFALHREFKKVKKFIKESDEGFTDYTVK